MIHPGDLMTLFKQAYDERWGYILGAAGETWTEAKQAAATREQTVKYGGKWIGRKVADCSGLFVWAYRQLGGKIYHGSNTIWRSYLSDKGSLTPDGRREDGKELLPGTAVFQMTPDPRQDDGENQSHIGLYMGGGQVIEAYGTSKGVILTDLVSRQWEQWGELKDVDYTGTVPPSGIRLTLRKGAKGDQVREMQERLMAHGYALPAHGADGDFGTETLAAVEAFQRASGLDVDGVVGKATWAALSADPPAVPPEDPPDAPWETWSVDDRLADLHRRLLALEGGKSNG